MERYFVITQFEDGYRQEEFIYEESAIEYCVMALDIPNNKIEDVNYNDIGM